MTITNLSPRARVIDNLRDDSETVTAIKGAMATLFILRWPPLRATSALVPEHME